VTSYVRTDHGWRSVDWSGTGWRIWRVGNGPTLDARGLQPLLRNPWDNSGLVDWWQPGQAKRCVCFLTLGLMLGGYACQGPASATCSCGIRSMATLRDLVAFLGRDRQIIRHPDKSAVVGRIRIGGVVQRRIPGFRPKTGYQRSQYAEIIGPLYVSPRFRRWADPLAAAYRPVEVVGPDLLPDTDGQWDWIQRLAEHLGPAY
jgi:hypothetical protein